MKSIAETIWQGSDGEATKRFYASLSKHGPIGQVAVALFRASKCSFRAKQYRGGIPGKGSYRDLAYERKNWSISELCKVLEKHALNLGIVWGWKEDKMQPFHRWVIYVTLPQGQVSFHSQTRGEGPSFSGEWDGQRLSTERICRFCNSILEAESSVAATR